MENAWNTLWKLIDRKHVAIAVYIAKTAALFAKLQYNRSETWMADKHLLNEDALLALLVMYNKVLTLVVDDCVLISCDFRVTAIVGLFVSNNFAHWIRACLTFSCCSSASMCCIKLTICLLTILNQELMFYSKTG